MPFIKNHKNKYKLIQRIASFSRLAILPALAIGLAVAGVGLSQQVSARNIEAEIKALERQVADYNKHAEELAKQSNTLRGRLAQLDNEQATLRSQISLTEAEQKKLAQEIDRMERRIKEQSKILGDNLRSQYYAGRTTPIDVLMNSKSVSEYVDHQSRLTSVGNEIKNSVNIIKQDRANLKIKKAEVDRVRKQQQLQQQSLQDSQNEQQRLLDDTEGKEEKYHELTKSHNSKIEALRREQAEILRRQLEAANGGRIHYMSSGQACGGGYPGWLCNAPQDSLVDPWRMYNRECVSYAAFKVASTFGWPAGWPVGRGNANQWAGNARALGLKVTARPAVHTVAQTSVGPYGHVGWVEAVSGDMVTISDYNRDGRGHFSRYTTHYTAFQNYIHF